MAANNQNVGHSPLARLKARVAEAAGAGTVSYSHGRRTFRPTIRLVQPANDNRVPLAVLIYRTLAIGAVIALLAAAILN